MFSIFHKMNNWKAIQHFLRYCFNKIKEYCYDWHLGNLRFYYSNEANSTNLRKFNVFLKRNVQRKPEIFPSDRVSYKFSECITNINIPVSLHHGYRLTGFIILINLRLTNTMKASLWLLNVGSVFYFCTGTN